MTPKCQGRAVVDQIDNKGPRKALQPTRDLTVGLNVLGPSDDSPPTRVPPCSTGVWKWLSRSLKEDRRE